ncbi:flagellin B, partial [Campylobacter hepaticus]|nr:flagellin B [Campylobacter hepaticus]
TGVEASRDENGRLVLTSRDGRGIKIEGDIGVSSGILNRQKENYGRLSLVKNDGRDINISGSGLSAIGMGNSDMISQTSVSLRESKGQIDANVADAMSQFARLKTSIGNAAGATKETAGVTTLKGAMAVMDIAQTAITNLDQIRADIGSVQNQLQVTINNITVTQVNVKSAESQIRDVDFASESANYSKANILAQRD